MRTTMLTTLILAGALCVVGAGCRSSSNPPEATPTMKQEQRDTGEILKVGDAAPDFQATDHLGEQHSLADYRGKKNVVLIFYPMNETPGCTKQLCSARDDWSKYEERGVQVFGVNPGTVESHRKFAENHGFPFPLLADTGKDLVRDYGAEGLLATKRTVYAIDKEGRIVFAERGLPSTDAILAGIPQ